MASRYYLCGLDIGTSKIIVSLARVERNRIVGISTEESTNGCGFNKGMVSNLSLLTQVIRNLVNTLQKRMACKVKGIYINFSSSHLNLRHSHAALLLSEKGNKIISSFDMKKVQDQAYKLGLRLEEYILHRIPLEYIVDEQNKTKDPRGLWGHKLAVDLYLISAHTRYIDNLIKAISGAGFEVEGIVFSGLATAFALLSPRQKQGCILLDIGADLTEINLFRDGMLNQVAILKMGGNDLTEVLVESLKVPFSLAEELKNSYASVFTNQIKEDQEIIIKKDSSYKSLSRKAVCEALESKINSFIVSLKEVVVDSFKLPDPFYGIVACGRTVLLEGFLEKLESELQIPVSLGNLKDVNPPSPSKSISYATSIGLILYGIESRQKKKAISLSPTSLFSNIKNRIKEMYQDYF